MKPAGVEYAYKVIEKICSFLDQPDRFKGKVVRFEPQDVAPHKMSTTTHHAVLGALVLLHYLDVDDRGRTGAKKGRRHAHHIYRATRSQLIELKKDAISFY